MKFKVGDTYINKQVPNRYYTVLKIYKHKGHMDVVWDDGTKDTYMMILSMNCIKANHIKSPLWKKLEGIK